MTPRAPARSPAGTLLLHRLVHRERPKSALFYDDLALLGFAYRGGWVRLRCKLAQKSVWVDAMERDSHWPTQELWLTRNDWLALGLPDAVDGALAMAPFEEAVVEVCRLRLPREPSLYLILLAFVLAAFASILAFFPMVNLAVPLAAVLTLAVSLATAIVTAVSAVLQRQPG